MEEFSDEDWNFLDKIIEKMGFDGDQNKKFFPEKIYKEFELSAGLGDARGAELMSWLNQNMNVLELDIEFYDDWDPEHPDETCTDEHPEITHYEWTIRREQHGGRSCEEIHPEQCHSVWLEKWEANNSKLIEEMIERYGSKAQRLLYGSDHTLGNTLGNNWPDDPHDW
jgi:hypothetical protein